MLGFKKVFPLFICTSVLYSCNRSFINSNFTPITSGEYENYSESIDVYFEGTEVNSDYIQIGFVESIGKKDASNDLLIAHLQYRAYKGGADAVINVKKMFNLPAKNSTQENSLPVFTGIAIKYTNGVSEDIKQRNRPDSGFLELIENDLEKTRKTEQIEILVYISVGVAFIVGFNSLLKNAEAKHKAIL